GRRVRPLCFPGHQPGDMAGDGVDLRGRDHFQVSNKVATGANPVSSRGASLARRYRRCRPSSRVAPSCRGVSTVRNARRVWLAAGGLLVLSGVALAAWHLREAEPTVTGTVRLDNEPLTTGSIAWIPIEGTPGPGGGGGINSEGKYEINRG